MASLTPESPAQENEAGSSAGAAAAATTSGGENRTSIDNDIDQNHDHHRHIAEPLPPFAPFLIPYRDCKVVTLIRHAQGYHNVAGERDREAYKSERYRDAHLTPRGWRQARRAGEHWRSVYESGKLPRPELVVVSPLMRTLETASAIFGFEGEGEEEDGGKDSKNNSNDNKGKKTKTLLMRPRPAIAGRVAATPFAAPLFADIPFVAHELVREETGVHPCDGRRPRSQSAQAFPGVDFSLVEHDEDTLHSEETREPRESVMARAETFARWLLSERPERHVAVVSHAGFLHFFARAIGAPHLSLSSASSIPFSQHGEALTSQLTRWFDNAESRVVVLANASGGGKGNDPSSPPSKKERDPLFFAGGGFEELEGEEEEEEVETEGKEKKEEVEVGV